MMRSVRKITLLVTSLIIIALLGITFGLFSAFNTTARADEQREFVLNDSVLESYDSFDAYWQDVIDVSPDLTQVTKVTLGADWETNDIIYVSANSNIILNLNGYKIQGPESDTVIIVNGTLEIVDEIEDGKEYNDKGEQRVGTITGGYADCGGGIYVDRSGNLTLSGGTVGDNEALDGGGGVYVLGGSFTMNGGTISGNKAGNYGGGVCVDSGRFFMNGGTISGNNAAYGGGIYTAVDLTLNGGTIEKNSTVVSGGGIYFNGNTLTLDGGTINENKASQNGGGIYSEYGGTLKINGGSVNGNTASNYGGGIYSGGDIYLTDGEINGNYSENQDGGGIYSAGDNFEMSGGSVYENKASQNGGGIYSAGNIFKMSGGSVYTNEVTGEDEGSNRGGGIYSGGEFYLSGGSVYANVAPRGGGIYSGSETFLSGSVSIESNQGLEKSNNFFLPTATKLNIIGSLSGSTVYVTLGEDYSGAFTQGYFENNKSGNPYPDDPNNYFYSDDGKYATIDSSKEVTFVDEQIQWQIKLDDGDYKDVDGYGVTLTYGTLIKGIKFNGEEIYEGDEECAAADEYEFAYNDVIFFVVIIPADINDVSVRFLNAEIKTTNNENEYVLVGEYNEPELEVRGKNSELLYRDADYELSIVFDETESKATITIAGMDNYTGERVLTLYVIKSGVEYDEYVGHDWQYYDETAGEWKTTNSPEFTYTGEDLKYNVRVSVHLKRISADNPEGEDIYEIITFASDGEWLLSLSDADGSSVNELCVAGNYTLTLEGAVTDTVDVTINRAELTDETILAENFGIGNENWLVHTGSQTVQLLDGNEVKFVKNGIVTTGESGQAYAYRRESNGIASDLSLALNGAAGAGAYVYSFDGMYVTVAYESVTDEQNTDIVKVTTTAKITFDNYYIGNETCDYIEIVKEWYIVTAGNGLRKFSETATSYAEITEDGSYQWEYGDLHDNGIFSYVFRPEHGEYAFVTIEGAGVQFAVRFTDNVTSFWEYSGNYVVGNRILDKHFLYDYLEGFNAGEYKLKVHVPQNSTTGTYKRWWDGNGEVNDYGVIYAEMNFTFTIEVTKYALPQNITLENNNGVYSYTDGKLTISYAGLIDYVSEVVIPEVTVTLKGRTLSEEFDYELTLLEKDNNPAWLFSLTAAEEGNLSGEITSVTLDGKTYNALPFEIRTKSNAFETLSIIAWKYGSYDSAVNVITAKATAGTLTLYLHENNRTVISDDEIIDTFTDTVLISFGEISTDANGTVILNDEFIGKIKDLGAGTYWLRAVATDANGVYETAESRIKFIVLQADNRWTVVPAVVSWRYGSFDAGINKISGTPLYGTAWFSVYKLNSDNSYTLLDLDGETQFKLDNGAIPDGWDLLFETLDTGTYYLCARVDGTDNFTGLNEKYINEEGETEDYSDEQISRFPSFSVFNLTNSWTVLPSVVGWTYDSFVSSVNVINGVSAYGVAQFSILDSDKTPISFNGQTTFGLTDGSLPPQVIAVLEKLDAGKYYLHAAVAPTTNYSGLDVTAPFTVAQFKNFWTETPNLPSWKWKEYDETVNLITASSASGEAPVVFRITYVENGSTKTLTFNGETTFSFVDGAIPDYVHSVLKDLTAGITYTLYASVDETDNYTGLEEVYTTFDVIPQTNYWQTSPNAVSWKWQEYDKDANSINALPAYGTVSITVYRNKDGNYEKVETDFAELDAGVYYICAVVEGTANYTGLNDGNVDFSRLPTFSVISANNYWRVMPVLNDWKWGEYDGAVNAISAVPAYGDKVEYSVYALRNGVYTALSFDGKTSFVLDGGKVPAAVEKVLEGLDAGTYYLRAYVAGTVNYSGLNEQTDNVTSYTAFHVVSVTNYWLVTPNVVSWRYGEYDPEVNVITATSAYGSVEFTVYREENGVFVKVDINSIGIENLSAGTYYLCASVAGTVNYSGINENITQSEIAELATFSIIKVRNQWEDVPALVGWSEGHYDNAVNAIVGSSRHGEVIFTVTDEKGNEIDITRLDKLGVGSYVLHAYVAGTDNYFELSASTTFAVFEDSVGMGRIITATVVFAVLAIGLAVTAILLLVRRNKKIAMEFLKVVRSEINEV